MNQNSEFQQTGSSPEDMLFNTQGTHFMTSFPQPEFVTNWYHQHSPEIIQVQPNQNESDQNIPNLIEGPKQQRKRKNNEERNKRERERIRNINEGFDTLSDSLAPFIGNGPLNP